MPSPVDYAEQVLGVHKVYEDALAAHKEYDSVVSDLDSCKDKRRVLDAELEAREVDKLIETRTVHPDWSKTAVNDHQKEARHNDPELRRLKGELNGLNSEIAGLEADAKVQEFLLSVFTSRMNELGGYFTFLAACKTAEQLAIQANNSSTGVQ